MLLGNSLKDKCSKMDNYKFRLGGNRNRRSVWVLLKSRPEISVKELRKSRNFSDLITCPIEKVNVTCSTRVAFHRTLIL